MLSSERGYSVIEKIKAEGYKIGLKKSRIEIATRMIAAGFPSSTISGITEIPIGEIEEMRAESAKPSAQS